MGIIIGKGGSDREKEQKSFHLCLGQIALEKRMKPDTPEEPYKDKCSLLENLRNSFADPSLSLEMLRENGCALAEEYTAILQQLTQLTLLSDTTQRKLLTADLKIQEQQDQL